MHNLDNMQQIDLDSPFIVGHWLVTPSLNSIALLSDDNQTKAPIKLTPKVMGLCLLLAKNRGQPINQEEIANALWPNRVISDSSIYQAIAQLRKALSEDIKHGDYVERVSGKGYRFIANISQPSATVTDDAIAQQTALNQTVQTNSQQIKRIAKRSLTIKALRLLGLCFAILLILAITLRQYFISNTPLNSTNKTIVVLATKNLTSPKIDSLDGFNQLLLSDLVAQPSLTFIHMREDVATPLAQLRLLTTVAQHQDGLLFSAQLINEQDGAVHWAKSFQVEQGQLLQVKNDMVASLLAHLLPESRLINNKIQKDSNHNRINSDPHFEQYALAQYLWDKRNVPTLNQAITIFQKILDQTPDHIGALVGLCHSHLYLSVYGNLTMNESYRRCQPLIARADRLNAKDARVMTAQAILLLHINKKNQAASLFQAAIKLAPNYAMAHLWYGNFLRQHGQYQAALTSHKIAYYLDPLSPVIIRALAYSYLNTRQTTLASKYYQRGLTIEPHYSHRALQELDFMPLNKNRARAYVRWVESNKANISKHTANRLTQALVWLGLGDSERAQRLISGLSIQDVNPGFLLYSQAALASAQGDLHSALDKLTQRLAISPDITRYAMPYISILDQLGHSSKALIKFNHYFSEINIDATIKRENVAQFIFLAQLHHANKQPRQSKQLVAKIIHYLDQQTILLPSPIQVYWLALRYPKDQQESIKTVIEKMLNDGWLPDYNDNMLSEQQMKNLYLKHGGTAKSWQQLLQANRQF